MIENEAPIVLQDVSVHSNKFLLLKKWPYLLAFLFLGASGFFVARMPVRPELAFVSSIFVVVFAVPSYMALIKWLGWRQGAILLLLLGIFALGLESIAILTGIPYGRFLYSDRIGGLVFGLVPWTVPFAWTPLLLMTYTLAQKVSRAPSAVPLTSALLLVMIDLVLDPAAVGQKFWAWSEPGPYFGVPWINFGGWLLSGFVGSCLFQQSLKWNGRSVPLSIVAAPTALLSSGLLILTFWTSVCFWMELWVPATLGVCLLFYSSRVYFGVAMPVHREVTP